MGYNVPGAMSFLWTCIPQGWPPLTQSSSFENCVLSYASNVSFNISSPFLLLLPHMVLKPVLAEEPYASVTCWIFTTWWSANTCFRAAEPSCGQHKRGCDILPQRSLCSILAKPCNFCPAFLWRSFVFFFFKSIQRSWKNLKRRGERRHLTKLEK